LTNLARTQLILNKIDLLPHVSFDLHQFREDVKHLSPKTRVLELSARSGRGVEEWIAWLNRRLVNRKPRKTTLSI
jgi:hydrogenase nickel incorporation protein HypB